MRNSRVRLMLLALALAPLVLLALRPAKRVHAQNNSETVIATYQVKAGREEDMLKVLAKHWATIHRLGMVLDQPHLVFRGKDDSGKTFFVEILTWEDSETPDNAPAEVRAIWAEMEPLVEARLGHGPIEFPEVHSVQYPAVP